MTNNALRNPKILFLKDLDSLEFESLLSDPLSEHSKILLSRYPMLNEQLQLRQYDDRDGLEYGGNQRNSSLPSSVQRSDVTKSLSIDEIDSAKFALFCKWLNESNFASKSLDDVRGSVNTRNNDKDSSDDEFVDTNSESVPVMSDQQFKDALPTVIEQANMSSVVHETNSPKEESAKNVIEEVNSEKSVKDEPIYETLPEIPPRRTNLLELPNASMLSLSLSCTSSVSDLTSESGKRPASHNKGKAPPIPSPAPQSITLDNTSMTASTQSIGGEKTVEQSLHDKEKKKKNLLNYIPSIFKPITPSSSSKNLFKETDI